MEIRLLKNQFIYLSSSQLYVFDNIFISPAPSNLCCIKLEIDGMVVASDFVNCGVGDLLQDGNTTELITTASDGYKQQQQQQKQQQQQQQQQQPYSLSTPVINNINKENRTISLLYSGDLPPSDLYQYFSDMLSHQGIKLSRAISQKDLPDVQLFFRIVDHAVLYNDYRPVIGEYLLEKPKKFALIVIANLDKCANGNFTYDIRPSNYPVEIFFIYVHGEHKSLVLEKKMEKAKIELNALLRFIST